MSTNCFCSADSPKGCPLDPLDEALQQAERHDARAGCIGATLEAISFSREFCSSQDLSTDLSIPEAFQIGCYWNCPGEVAYSDTLSDEDDGDENLLSCAGCDISIAEAFQMGCDWDCPGEVAYSDTLSDESL